MSKHGNRMTEDSSFHWRTKPQMSLIRNVPARQS